MTIIKGGCICGRDYYTVTEQCDDVECRSERRKDKMEKIYLITYRDMNGGGDTLEGYVEKREDFDNWLFEHNRQREVDGEEPEDKIGFKITEVDKLW